MGSPGKERSFEEEDHTVVDGSSLCCTGVLGCSLGLDNYGHNSHQARLVLLLSGRATRSMLSSGILLS